MRAERVRGFYGVVDLKPVHAGEYDRPRPRAPEPGGHGIADALALAVDDTGPVPEAGRDRYLGVELAQKLIAGGAAVIQLRMKGAPVRLLHEVAAAIQPVVHAAGALFVVNDRLDVAVAVSADGVHLGQDDLPLRAARAAAAGRLLIGISTHNAEQAVEAARGGADYLGFGPIWDTTSKDDPDPTQGVVGLAAAIDALARVGSSPPPVVAIGGITPDRAHMIASAGAAAACVISAVNGAPDVTAAARRVAAAFARRA